MWQDVFMFTIVVIIDDPWKVRKLRVWGELGVFQEVKFWGRYEVLGSREFLDS